MRGLNPLALLVAGAFFMEFLDGTIIVTALPQMAPSFGASAVDLNIGVSAYLLTVAVFILPGGWAAERFGGRRVFTAAIVLFTVASALCGLANSVGGFVAARTLQGIGGAMMVPVGRLIVLRTTAKADLMRAVATLTWPGLTAPLLGPPLGGFIAQHLHWRFIFLVNVPLGCIALLLAFRLVPKLAASARRPFDLPGFALAAASCTCATIGLDSVGGSGGLWGAALLAAAVLAGLWLVRHLRQAAHPLIDLAPWAVPTFRLASAGGTVMRTLIAAMPFLLPLLFQLGFGYDPFHAGLLVLTLFAGNIGIKPATTPLLRRFGFRTILLGNGLLQAACMAGCALLSPGTPIPLIVGLLLLAGASRSTQFTALGTLVFADVPQPSMAPANTWFSVAFQLGNGMGVAVGALLLRVADILAGRAAAFRLTFVALAALMLLATASAVSLRRDAGAVVSGHRLRPASS